MNTALVENSSNSSNWFRKHEVTKLQAQTREIFGTVFASDDWETFGTAFIDCSLLMRSLIICCI